MEVKGLLTRQMLIIFRRASLVENPKIKNIMLDLIKINQ